MDGRTGGWMDGWMGGRPGGCMDGRIVECLRTSEQVGG